jgi:putative membrane protein
MNAMKSAPLLALAGLAAVALAQAQTPPPDSGQSADPSAASTPHQREATGSQTTESPTPGSPEASAASTPHQREATGMAASESELKMASAEGAKPASFVKNAAVDGMAEVELGKLALSKSQDEAIRNFAQRMVTDHGKANQELKTIAKRKNIDVPTSLDSKHQSLVQSLNAKSGAAFDAAYAEHMQADHSKAIALFEGASKSSDEDLAAFAKKTLPTLEEHKQMADALPAGSRSANAEDKSMPKRE